MVKVIMHGCNGKMGQVISGLIAADPDMELVAGIDARDDGHNPYPVFTDIEKCDVAAHYRYNHLFYMGCTDRLAQLVCRSCVADHECIYTCSNVCNR